MIKAYVFDLDGTLFDSTAANIKSYADAFKDLGIKFDEQAYIKNFGHRFSEMMNIVAPHTDQATRAQIKNRKTEYYRQNLELVKPNTGLLELAKNAKGSYKTALVTTASKNNVTSLLSHFNFKITWFDVVLTGEDVSKSKPDPEAYLKAVKQLNTKPEECIVFEDSDIGIAAATSAGCHVVRVKI